MATDWPIILPWTRSLSPSTRHPHSWPARSSSWRPRPSCWRLASPADGARPLLGTVAATAALAVIIGTLGVAIVTVVPEHLLKGVVGALLLLFGLRWLRKAILRF